MRDRGDRWTVVARTPPGSDSGGLGHPDAAQESWRSRAGVRRPAGALATGTAGYVRRSARWNRWLPVRPRGPGGPRVIRGPPRRTDRSADPARLRGGRTARHAGRFCLRRLRRRLDADVVTRRVGGASEPRSIGPVQRVRITSWRLRLPRDRRCAARLRHSPRTRGTDRPAGRAPLAAPPAVHAHR